MKRALPLVLILLCCLTSTAQESLSDRAKSFRSPDKFEVSYDRFKNQTRVTLDGLIIKPRLQMSAYASFTGQRPYYARNVVLTFTTTETLSRFEYHRELEIITDGKRGKFPKGTWIKRQTSQSLGFAMTIQEARELATAGLTEIRVGMVEAILNTEHKQALRDFLSLVTIAPR